MSSERCVTFFTNEDIEKSQFYLPDPDIVAHGLEFESNSEIFGVNVFTQLDLPAYCLALSDSSPDVNTARLSLLSVARSRYNRAMRGKGHVCQCYIEPITMKATSLPVNGDILQVLDPDITIGYTWWFIVAHGIDCKDSHDCVQFQDVVEEILMEAKTAEAVHADDANLQALGLQAFSHDVEIGVNSDSLSEQDVAANSNAALNRAVQSSAVRVGSTPNNASNDSATRGQKRKHSGSKSKNSKRVRARKLASLPYVQYLYKHQGDEGVYTDNAPFKQFLAEGVSCVHPTSGAGSCALQKLREFVVHEPRATTVGTGSSEPTTFGIGTSSQVDVSLMDDIRCLSLRPISVFMERAYNAHEYKTVCSRYSEFEKYFTIDGNFTIPTLHQNCFQPIDIVPNRVDISDYIALQRNVRVLWSRSRTPLKTAVETMSDACQITVDASLLDMTRSEVVAAILSQNTTVLEFIAFCNDTREGLVEKAVAALALPIQLIAKEYRMITTSDVVSKMIAEDRDAVKLSLDELVRQDQDLALEILDRKIMCLWNNVFVEAPSVKMGKGVHAMFCYLFPHRKQLGALNVLRDEYDKFVPFKDLTAFGNMVVFLQGLMAELEGISGHMDTLLVSWVTIASAGASVLHPDKSFHYVIEGIAGSGKSHLMTETVMKHHVPSGLVIDVAQVTKASVANGENNAGTVLYSDEAPEMQVKVGVANSIASTMKSMLTSGVASRRKSVFVKSDSGPIDANYQSQDTVSRYGGSMMFCCNHLPALMSNGKHGDAALLSRFLTSIFYEPADTLTFSPDVKSMKKKSIEDSNELLRRRTQVRSGMKMFVAIAYAVCHYKGCINANFKVEKTALRVLERFKSVLKTEGLDAPSRDVYRIEQLAGMFALFEQIFRIFLQPDFDGIDVQSLVCTCIDKTVVQPDHMFAACGEVVASLRSVKDSSLMAAIIMQEAKWVSCKPIREFFYEAPDESTRANFTAPTNGNPSTDDNAPTDGESKEAIVAVPAGVFRYVCVGTFSNVFQALRPYIDMCRIAFDNTSCMSFLERLESLHIKTAGYSMENGVLKTTTNFGVQLRPIVMKLNFKGTWRYAINLAVFSKQFAFSDCFNLLSKLVKACSEIVPHKKMWCTLKPPLVTKSISRGVINYACVKLFQSTGIADTEWTRIENFTVHMDKERWLTLPSVLAAYHPDNDICHRFGFYNTPWMVLPIVSLKLLQFKLELQKHIDKLERSNIEEIIRNAEALLLVTNSTLACRNLNAIIDICKGKLRREDDSSVNTLLEMALLDAIKSVKSPDDADTALKCVSRAIKFIARQSACSWAYEYCLNLFLMLVEAVIGISSDGRDKKSIMEQFCLSRAAYDGLLFTCKNFSTVRAVLGQVADENGSTVEMAIGGELFDEVAMSVSNAIAVLDDRTNVNDDSDDEDQMLIPPSQRFAVSQTAFRTRNNYLATAIVDDFKEQCKFKQQLTGGHTLE